MNKPARKRSAIVPAVVFSAALATSVGVIPNIVGCSDDTKQQQGYGLDVAYRSFDMSHHLPGLDVAFLGFDMSEHD